MSSNVIEYFFRKLLKISKLEPIIQSEISQKEKHQYNISSVQFSSVAQLCPTLCDPMNRSTPGLPVHHQLRRVYPNSYTESVMPSNHLIFCRSLLLLPSVFPSIRVFSNESVLLIYYLSQSSWARDKKSFCTPLGPGVFKDSLYSN